MKKRTLAGLFAEDLALMMVEQLAVPSLARPATVCKSVWTTSGAAAVKTTWESAATMECTRITAVTTRTLESSALVVTQALVSSTHS